MMTIHGGDARCAMLNRFLPLLTAARRVEGMDSRRMAIDFMIMPLSRYIAGDFITPAMQMSWDLSSSYRIIGPNGVRDIPPNTPFGGVGAAARREQILPDVLDDLRLAFPDRLPWDERSSSAPRFHRVNPASFQALITHAKSLVSPERAHVLHLFGSLFVPAQLSQLLKIEAPIEAIVSSTSVALGALDQPFPAEAESARQTLRDALQDASELGLPMIVDA